MNYPLVIFVRPQAPGNIGALARVMSNFGPTELRLVGEDPWKHRSPDDPYQNMDWALAKRGEPILKNARWYPDLRSALEGVHLAIGSSGREVEFERGYARPHLTPRAAFETVRDWHEEAPGNMKWALVLGPEDDGLNDHEAALCQKLIRIPTADMNPSLNIAMAAGCMFYEWHLFMIGQGPAPRETGAFLDPARGEKRRHSTEAGRADWATADQCEDFLDYLMGTLSKTQFLKYPDDESVKARLRRWLQSAPIPLGELLFAFEVVYHLRAWGTGHFEPRDFLKRRKID